MDVNKELLSRVKEKKDEDLEQGILDSNTIIDTENEARDGQNKCPRCGSTDISLNPRTAKLRCDFCRFELAYEFAEGIEQDLSKLRGRKIGLGAKDIRADVNDLVTLKCESCGSELVIDSREASQARCHWCRNTLSLNQKIDNGSIPDLLLPFKLTREEAQAKIEEFVAKRKFFAHPSFRREFSLNNIMGVYFPYMLVDINAHSKLEGRGELNIRSYTVKNEDKEDKYYDVEVYDVGREFDLEIRNLSVESSIERIDRSKKGRTNNIINSIMPFDTENCVKWNANYIKGFSSEKRDLNIDQLEATVKAQSRDIAKFKINETLKQYDRGVQWNKNDLDIKGDQWISTYLPVWLYSYQEKKAKSSLIHYIAVNARTQETMGSVPVYIPKLAAVSTLIELASILFMLFYDFGDDFNWQFLFLLPGILFFLSIYLKYRNTDARHSYESETTAEIRNLISKDQFVTTKMRVKESSMAGANNKKLEGNYYKSTDNR